MSDNIIIHLNSLYKDKLETLDNFDNYRSRLTFYFDNPIILNERYDLYIDKFNLKKSFVGNTIRWNEDLTGLDTFTTDTTLNIITPTLYNTVVENITTLDVTILTWDGSAFQTSDARAQIAVEKNSGNDNGSIVSAFYTTSGSGFALNDYVYIDKTQITGTFNSFTNRYAEFQINSLTDTDVILELSNYATRTINPAQNGVAINERTYSAITLWKDDGAGWYENSGATADCEVKLPYAGATFANIDITGIVDGGSGFSLNDFVYIDKVAIIAGEPTMTYNVRFAKYQVSALVNGINSSVLSANVEMLPNPRENTIVGGAVYNDIPLLTLLNVDTGARATVTVIASPVPGDNTARLNIMTITNPGTGFTVGDDFYIDKELVVPPNQYVLADRYAKYTVSTLDTGGRDIEIVNATNWGYNSSFNEGLWYYDIPNTSTRLHFEVHTPVGFSRQARILRLSGGDYLGWSVGDVIDIVSSDVVLEVSGSAGSAGDIGIGKQYGDLQIEVLTTTTVSSVSEIYEVALENLRYNMIDYFNSDTKSYPTLILTDLINKGVNSKEQILTLEPQIISSINLLFSKELGTDEVFDLSILLKKNNIYN